MINVLLLVQLNLCIAFHSLITSNHRLLIQQCSDGYFSDGSKCIRCHESCRTCIGESDENCLTCFNALVQYHGKCTCGVGKFQTDMQYCHDTCNYCQGPTYQDCLACISSQFRELVNYTCVCRVGYFENGNNNCQCNIEFQQECPPECVQCSDLVTCQSCSTPYILSGSICGIPLLSDQIRCHYTCLTCSGSSMSQCQTCQNNRSLINGVCQCNLTFREDNQQGCTACPYQCETCKSDQTCQTCLSGNRLVNNECICQSGLQKFNCGISCPTGCDICNNSTCYTCFSPYILEGSSCVCPNQTSGPGCTTACNSTCKYCDPNNINNCTICVTTVRWQENSVCYRINNINLVNPIGCYNWNGSNCTNCRTTGITNSNCTCVAGYVGASTLGQCVACHLKCYTCDGITENDCTNCIGGQNRVLQGRTCACSSGYREIIGHTTCQDSSYIYQCNAQSGATCTSCNTSNTFRINDPTKNCPCRVGYYNQIDNINCQVCSIRYCLVCQDHAATPICVECKPNRISLPDCLCSDGYYDLGTLNDCLPCPYGCQLCNNASICISCKDNFLLTTDLKCPCTKVNYFDPKTCLCLGGYYQDIESNQCLPCNPQCRTCEFNAHNCTMCSDGFNQIPNCSCQHHQDPDSLSCVFCPIDCLECTSNGVCTVCAENRLANPPYCDCPLTKFHIQNEYDCNSCGLWCKECRYDLNYCTKCIPYRTNEPLCNLCMSGAYLTSTNLCQPCAIKCGTCITNFDNCLSCGINRIEPLATCICKPGYYDVPGLQCQPCNFKCQQCITTATNCTECSSFRVISPDCLCSPGYYEIGVASCQKCYYQCLTCVGTHDNCTSCDPNLNRTLVGSECHCMDTFIKFNNQCKCDLLEFQNIALHKCELCDRKCLRCELSATNCLICQIHRVNQPVCNCQDQYYMDVNSDCQICNYKCATCTFESTKCTKCYATRAGIPSCNCQDGYFESFNQICNICQSVCKTCIGPDVNQCTSCDDTANRKYATGMICECKDKFVERDSKCIPCEIQYPECQPFICGDGLLVRGEQCDDGNNNDRDGCSATCLFEPQSYCQLKNHPLYPTLYLSKCVKCMSNCSKCNDTLCLVCQTQYYLDQDIYCRPCNLHCQSCSGPEQNQCITCATGYDYGFKEKCAFCSETVGLITAGDKCVNVCGDGILKSDYGEICDDGNIADGDGCSSSCEVEIEYSCSAEELIISVCIKLDYPKASISIQKLINEYQTYRTAQLRFTKQMRYVTDMELWWTYQLSDYNSSYFNISKIDLIVDIENTLIGFDFRIELLQSIQASNFIIQFNNKTIKDLSNGYPYLSQTIQVYQIYIYYKCTMAKYDALPDSTLSTSQKAVDLTTSMLIIISAVSGVGILLGGFSFLWNILDNVQQLSYLTFVNIKYPFVIDEFLNLFSFAQLTFIGDYVDDKYFDFIDGYTQYRQAQLFLKGVEPQLLLNLKSSIVIFVASYAIYLSCKVIYQISQTLMNQLKYLHYFSIIKPLYKLLKFIQYMSYSYHSNYFYLIIIRLYLSTIYDLNQALFTTYYYYGYETSNLSLMIEAVIALTLFIIQNAIMFHQYRLLYFTRGALQCKSNYRFYGAISEGIKISKFNSFIQVTQILRKQLFMFFLIGLYDSPVMQCLCLLLLNLTFTLLLFVSLPFEQKMENIKLVLSELAALSSLMINLGYCMSGYKIYEFDPDTFNFIGFVQIGIYALMLAINLFIDLTQQLGELYKANLQTINRIKDYCGL